MVEWLWWALLRIGFWPHRHFLFPSTTWKRGRHHFQLLMETAYRRVYISPSHLSIYNRVILSLNMAFGRQVVVLHKDVGAIRFAFRVLQLLYWLDLHSETSVSIADLWWSINKTVWKIRPRLIWLWWLKMHVCWFLNLDGLGPSSQLRSLSSVEWLINFAELIQSLSNMRVYGVCYLILT